MREETIGSVLVDARNQAGLSQEEIAGQMNLMVSTIRALEEDDFTNLPGPTYVRGYLHTYSKLVGLDAGQLIRIYNEQHPSEPEHRPPSRPNRRRGTAVLWTAAAVIVLAGVYVLLQGPGSEPSVQAPELAEAPGEPLVGPEEVLEAAPEMSEASEGSEISEIPETLVVGPEEVLEAAPEMSEASEGSEISKTPETPEVSEVPEVSEAPEAPGAPEVADVGVPVPVEDSQNQDLPVAEASDAGQVGSPEAESLQKEEQRPVANGLSVTDGNLEVLTMTFMDDCWIEIRDADMQLLHWDLMWSGASLEIEGKAPFEVLLGNSPDVIIHIEGKRFDHSRFHQSDRTSRFKVSSSLLN